MKQNKTKQTPETNQTNETTKRNLMESWKKRLFVNICFNSTFFSLQTLSHTIVAKNIIPINKAYLEGWLAFFNMC